MSRIVSFIVFFLLLSGSEIKYKIISISTPDILIGSVRMVKGNTFDADQNIHWENDTQVMRVVDVETEEMFVLSKQIMEVAKKRSMASYAGIGNALSTDMMALEQASASGGYYYISFVDDGRPVKIRLEAGMFMDEYPDQLSLYYFNPQTSASELRTDDFRDFVDDLIITDDMVKRNMSGVDYFRGEENVMKKDYMTMMHTYVDERFADIVYTYDDLKMFLTLKY